MCVLIGACALIRMDMVYTHVNETYIARFMWSQLHGHVDKPDDFFFFNSFKLGVPFMEHRQTA